MDTIFKIRRNIPAVKAPELIKPVNHRMFTLHKNWLQMYSMRLLAAEQPTKVLPVCTKTNENGMTKKPCLGLKLKLV